MLELADGTFTLTGGVDELVNLPTSEARGVVLALDFREMAAADVVMVTMLTHVVTAFDVTMFSREFEFGVTTDEMWAATLGDPLATGYVSPAVPVRTIGNITVNVEQTAGAAFDLGFVLYSIGAPG